MPDICRNNHYVPQFYLNAWTINKKIWEYRLLVSNERVPLWTNRSVEHVASGENMYVRMISGEEYDDFEIDFNCRFETPASEPFRKLCKRDKLKASDWSAIARMAACQYVRTPAYFQSIKPTMDKLHKSFAEEMPSFIERYAKGERSAPHEEVDRTLFPMSLQLTGKRIDDTHQEAYFTLISGKSIWLFAIQHALTDGSSILDIFQNRKWSIVSFRNHLPTTDNPICFVDAIAEMPIDDIGTKMSKKGKLIVYPISPELAIISKTEGKRLPPAFIASFIFAEYIKRAVVKNAFMYVYSKEIDNDIPSYRPRVVNLKQYKQVDEAIGGWYSKYQSEEAPLLKHDGSHLSPPDEETQISEIT